uniref:NADH dehydrogenase subunit 4 n=1 Tax=Hexagenia rigida TaxID=197160 RepID=UPI001FCD36B5|nr:NADH dehydrogenase subunit 4 [Hexagenia rigida]UNH92451.1 NADH dehydrogenase subunit 4 [Hexagenia rigida]
MLSFLLSLLGLIPLSFIFQGWHLVHLALYILTFMFLFMGSYPFYHYNMSYFMGCDVISFGLILLSFWICALMITASQSILKTNYNKELFVFMVMFLMLMLYLTFSSTNLFLFYLFFEASLIPTLLLILGWGYQPERMQAGMYLLFYTLLASLPLLVGIFYIYSSLGTLFLPMLGKFSISGKGLFYLVMVFAFLVKMPMFLVHLWLPKAHVEAPVSGSMILAGVLLKLGGYGLLRVMNMLSILGLKFNFIWVGISLIGGCLVSFICLRQTDLKALVAYSSVAHMGLVLGGLMTLSYWGIAGAYTLMIAHGLCSSGLFCLTNISYERLGSRSLVINKGLMHFMPSMTLWWFLLSSANMAAPPTLNLLGEIVLLNSLVGWCWLTMLTLMILSFFSAAYTLYLYSYSQHGKVYSAIYFCVGGYSREYLLLFLHWVPLNVLIMKSESMILWL